MSPFALDLPGPSRRIRVEPLAPPAPAPSSPRRDPVRAPDPARAPAHDPAPAPADPREPAPA